MTATSFEQVVGRARQLGYRQIVWWTLRAVDNGFASRNAVIRQELATGKYPDVVIADWDRYTANRSQWFVSDGVHFRPIGAWAAADYLSRKMAFLEQRPCPMPTSPGRGAAGSVPGSRRDGTDRHDRVALPDRKRVSASRWAWAEVDLDALDHNVGVIREVVAPAAVWAVVKADGYGHGAPAIAAQALRSGAAGLCVALTQEGIDLRRAGIEAPILVLSEQPPDQLVDLLAAGLTPTVYSIAYADALAATVASGAAASCHLHVKVDTGMQRVGIQPADVAALRRPRPRARAAAPHRRRLHAPCLRRRSCRAVQRCAAGGVRAGARRTRRSWAAADVHARRQLGRSARPSRESLRHGARRDRDLRRLAGARCRPPRR